jgi:hypothetical protein
MKSLLNNPAEGAAPRPHTGPRLRRVSGRMMIHHILLDTVQEKGVRGTSLATYPVCKDGR